MADSRFKQATLISKKWISDKVLELIFEPKVPLAFKPGQFISVKIADTMYFRAYSIASDAHNSRRFTLIADAKHEGRGSNYFRAMQLQDTIEFVGPAGNFVIAKEAKPNILFLCTGTGIAPFIPMWYQLKSQNFSGKVRVLFGVRTLENLFYQDVLADFSTALSDFKFEICVSQPEQKYQYFEGRLTSLLKILLDESNEFAAPKQHTISPANPLSDIFANKEAIQVYVCGNPRMIEDATSMLIKAGISEEDIYYEKFTFAGT